MGRFVCAKSAIGDLLYFPLSGVTFFAGSLVIRGMTRPNDYLGKPVSLPKPSKKK